MDAQIRFCLSLQRGRNFLSEYQRAFLVASDVTDEYDVLHISRRNWQKSKGEEERTKIEKVASFGVLIDLESHFSYSFPVVSFIQVHSSL